ncbi:MAG: biotin synthase BioB [Nitrospira bacterium HGW-Nitrospira-1]|nr:MAG: biotin synthase BioB [Nitrospira bacterium HGW-Nitrospira-1]
MLKKLEKKVLDNGEISGQDALFITTLDGQDVFDLFASANRIREHFRGNTVDLCAIINAKSGACPEDCSYCAQSARSAAEIKTFRLVEKETVLEKAKEAKNGRARRFCIVTSGKKASAKDLSKIAEMVSSVRELGLLPCATLGLLSKNELVLLKNSGLERYHNNLETSERFFSEICTTHTYQDKIKTIKEVKSSGLSLCSGGIFGLGETWEDRIDMAFALRDIGPDSVPINFLTPVKGTRLGMNMILDPFDALKIISLYRFILPDKEIRVCGGRIQTLGELHSFIFLAGADSLLTGNYLTTLGRNYEDDLRLINQCGLKA